MKKISLINIIIALFTKPVVANCGHQTKFYGFIHPCGEKTFIIQPANPPTLYCLKCLESTAIKCAKCGSKIFSGEPYILYGHPENIELPKYAAIYSEKPLQYIVCNQCNIYGRDHGIWSPKKYEISKKLPLNNQK